MTGQDLKYVVSVLKDEKTNGAPDWYAVLGFLSCHRIAGLFYKHAKKCGLELPKKAEKILKETYERQRRKVVFMRKELAAITTNLSEMKVPYMLLKGSVLTNLGEDDIVIYADGERSSNDIDLLSLPEGITPISKTLRELGFIQGEYDRNSDAIKEFSRTEIVKRRMNRGEVAPFVKKTGNTEFPFIEVDINFSLGNTPSEGSALLREMIENSVEYNGKVPMKVPDGALFFLHLIMHQYKESCLMFMVERNKDLDLYKLADIYYLLKADVLDYERLEMLVKKHSLNQEVGTVLKQVGEIFADYEITDYAKKFESIEPIVIDYENKKGYKRRGTIIQRLCSLDSEKYLIEVGKDDH